MSGSPMSLIKSGLIELPGAHNSTLPLIVSAAICTSNGGEKCVPSASTPTTDGDDAQNSAHLSLDSSTNSPPCWEKASSK